MNKTVVSTMSVLSEKSLLAAIKGYSLPVFFLIALFGAVMARAEMQALSSGAEVFNAFRAATQEGSSLKALSGFSSLGAAELKQVESLANNFKGAGLLPSASESEAWEKLSLVATTSGAEAVTKSLSTLLANHTVLTSDALISQLKKDEAVSRQSHEQSVLSALPASETVDTDAVMADLSAFATTQAAASVATKKIEELDVCSTRTCDEAKTTIAKLATHGANYLKGHYSGAEQETLMKGLQSAIVYLTPIIAEGVTPSGVVFLADSLTAFQATEAQQMSTVFGNLVRYSSQISSGNLSAEAQKIHACFNHGEEGTQFELASAAAIK